MTVRTPKANSARRGAFTLVEMLTVIVIIGILAGLTVGGAIAARNAVRRGIIIADMKQLELALNSYKNDAGEFPPDFAFCDETSPRGAAARARVVRHLRKRFPRMRLPGANDDAKFIAFLSALPLLPDGTPYSVGPGAKSLNPSTALTFWIGGILDSDGKPRGFHDDETNPFKLGEPRSKPYYDFNPERMVGLQLNQPNVQPVAPICYFRPFKNTATGRYEYGDSNAGVFTPFIWRSGDSVCVPYLENCRSNSSGAPDPLNPDHLRDWRAAETYQIIAAGLDGVFSTSTPAPPTPFRYTIIGENFTDGDFDNLTSFANGELETEM